MKTVEQKSEEYLMCNFDSNDIDLSDAFKEGVTFAQRWIPIEEELPEKLVQVIVKLENGWCTCTWITEDGDFAFNVKPTYWRPIELK